MTTTTIRVDLSTRDALNELAQEQGATLGETVRDAAEALRRARFARRTSDAFARLRADSEAWRSYEAEAEATSVSDGLA
jgi:hypothetical protein